MSDDVKPFIIRRAATRDMRLLEAQIRDHTSSMYVAQERTSEIQRELADPDIEYWVLIPEPSAMVGPGVTQIYWYLERVRELHAPRRFRPLVISGTKVCPVCDADVRATECEIKFSGFELQPIAKCARVTDAAEGAARVADWRAWQADKDKKALEQQ